jgi:hypothetical protein
MEVRLKMDRIISGTPRRLLTLGGVLAAFTLVFAATPAAQATHTTGCGNHQGEAALLGCDNQATLSTQLTMPVNGVALWVKQTGPGSTEGNWGLLAEGRSIGMVGKGFHAGVSGNGTQTGVEGSGNVGVTGTGDAGVHGTGDFVGVRAESPGTALQVIGKAAFSRSGKTSIGAGLTRKAVSMTNLSTSTLVTATVQGAPTSGLYVLSVRVQPSLNTFTIYLSKAVPAGKTAAVGWFVAN